MKVSRLEIIPPLFANNGAHPRWRWHHRALVKLRERLLKHRAELAAAVVQALESAHDDDLADAATEEFDHDLMLSRLSAEQEVLYEIEAALNRIRSGSYGVCELTGKPIAAARLRAVPWTRYCRDVEEQLEREGVFHPARLGELKSVRASVPGDLEEVNPGANDQSLTETRGPRPLPGDFSGEKRIRRSTRSNVATRQ